AQSLEAELKDYVPNVALSSELIAPPATAVRSQTLISSGEITGFYLAISALLAAGLLVAVLQRTPAPGSARLPSPTAIATPTPHPADTAVRAGGINTVPSYRPDVYLGGPEPDSWWCQLPHCYETTDPLQGV